MAGSIKGTGGMRSGSFRCFLTDDLTLHCNASTRGLALTSGRGPNKIQCERSSWPRFRKAQRVATATRHHDHLRLWRASISTTSSIWPAASVQECSRFCRGGAHYATRWSSLGELRARGFSIHSAHGCWGGQTIRAAVSTWARPIRRTHEESVDDLMRCVDWLAAAGGKCLVVHPGGLVR